MKLLIPLLFLANIGFCQYDPNSEPEEAALEIPDEMAEFPGGEAAMMKFISHNISYPKDAMNKGIQGTVYIQFVVEKDGSLSTIEVIRGIDSSLDEEAIRVIKQMPHWIPAMHGGKKVRSIFRLPIRYRLM